MKIPCLIYYIPLIHVMPAFSDLLTHAFAPAAAVVAAIYFTHLQPDAL